MWREEETINSNDDISVTGPASLAVIHNSVMLICKLQLKIAISPSVIHQSIMHGAAWQSALSVIIIVNGSHLRDEAFIFPRLADAHTSSWIICANPPFCGLGWSLIGIYYGLLHASLLQFGCLLLVVPAASSRERERERDASLKQHILITVTS